MPTFFNSKKKRAEITLVAEVAAQWWTERLKQGDRLQFKCSLTKSIKEAIIKDGIARLGSDYDPCQKLKAATVAAGLELWGCNSSQGVMPMKTNMVIWPDRVRVKHGYGAPYEMLEVKDHA